MRPVAVRLAMMPSALRSSRSCNQMGSTQKMCFKQRDSPLLSRTSLWTEKVCFIIGVLLHLASKCDCNHLLGVLEAHTPFLLKPPHVYQPTRNHGSCRRILLLMHDFSLYSSGASIMIRGFARNRGVQHVHDSVPKTLTTLFSLLTGGTRTCIHTPGEPLHPDEISEDLTKDLLEVLFV